MNTVRFLSFMLLLSLLGIGSCKQNDPGPGAGKLVVTNPGEPTGAAVSASIGPAGGTLSSPDGAVTLEIPAGALDAATTISIQPINNTAPLGVQGGAYRFSPDGQKFKVPVKLTFRYTDEILSGASPELLWVMTQAADGSWKALLSSSVNAATKTVTGEIKHFSDWVFGRFMDLTLSPASATLKPGASVNVNVAGFKSTQADEEDNLAPLISEEITELAPLVEFLAPLSPSFDKQERVFEAKQWRLAGEGQLQANGFSAKYTAPGSVPSRNPVAVSLELEYGKGTPRQKLLLVSNITILEEGVLTFTLDGKEYKAYENRFENGAGLAYAQRSTEGGFFISAAVNVPWSFNLTIKKPQEGIITSELCASKPGGLADDVEIDFTSGNLSYGNGYYKRIRMESGACNMNANNDNGRCGPATFVIKLDQFGNKVGDTVSGSFSGTIYNDAEASRNCTSSSMHRISGVFNLSIRP